MDPLLQKIIAGCVVGCTVTLFGLFLKSLLSASHQLTKLRSDLAEMKGEVHTMKEYWMRTAERRDNVLREADRWKNYALKLQGVNPALLEPFAHAVPEQQVCQAAPAEPALGPVPEVNL